MKKVALHNLGCKVNAYETEAMQELLEQHGYEIVPFKEGADVYIINTCTVTNMADRKSRQMLHRARKMNPGAVVVACGCYVQAKRDEIDDCIDIVVGNNRKKDIIEILSEHEAMQEGVQKELVDINNINEYEELRLSQTAEHTRAYIKVQDGCNQFCSYCIIPYARGRVRSRAMEDVIKEATALAGNGCREVVLTGIHLSSYGVDQGTSLLELIRAVHQVEGICRIRLGSLEPGIITEEFAEALGELPKLCPHFHLSLQSGCTSTLKRMNRRYTAEEFEEKCRILRQVFDRPAITTDVIAGFPGETEEEFETTYDFLSRIRLYETHIFKYSRRHGTRAASMPDQVPEQVKGQRSDRLIALGEKNRRLFEQQYAGELTEVLFEEKTVIEGKEYYTGYNKQYIKLAVPADGDYENVLIQGRIAKEVAPHLFLLEQEKY